MNQEIQKKLTAFFIMHKKQTFRKGGILIRADEDPLGIYFIQEGIVRQYYISKNGEEITLNMFKSFAFFPMSWSISDIHNNYYYEAMTDCVVYKAPKETTLAFMKKEPDVLLDLLRRIYIGIEGLWMHIEYLSGGSAFNKLIATLLILGKRFGKKEKEGVVIQIKLSEKDLSEYAGMYRETVSRELQKLREQGLVLFYKGSITIPDLNKLESSLAL